MSLDLVRRVSAANRWLAVVATTRPDVSVHASLVNAGVLDDPVTGQPVIGLVASGHARKLAYIRGSGRAAVTFQSGWEWVTAEGPARVAGPDDPLEGLPSTEIPELLRAVFRAAGGSHDDWEEYDRVMAAERRTAVLIEPARFLTNG